MEVTILDLEYVSLLACRLAVEINLSPAQNADEKRLAIQDLLPVVTQDPTAQDTVLARLLLLLPPGACVVADL